MKNMVDYAEMTLPTVSEKPFCVVDSLILGQFSAFKLEHTAARHPKWKGVTIAQLADDENFDKMFVDIWNPEGSKRMLRAMAKNPRFRDAVVKGYSTETDDDLQKQFAAVCVQFTPELCYVVFRGTDSSVTGWKEDFNMAFQSPVPSQTEAVRYLNNAARHCTGKLIVGGHSKGGNLAVYSSAFAKPSVKRRIQKIYSHDGPGFLPSVLDSDEFRSVCDRIDKTVPQSSFVGMLLESQEKFRVVKSNRQSIMQHDPFSWEVKDFDLVPVASLTATATYLDATLSGWLGGISAEHRKRLVDLIFSFLDTQNVTSGDDVINDPKKYAKLAMRAVNKEEPETRQFVKQTIRALISLGIKNFPQLFKRKK